MTIEELRSTFEYRLLTKMQRGYVEHFILSRDSVASARIAYNPRTRSTLYTIFKQNRRNIRIQACIARYDANSKNGVLRLLKEAALGKRKMSRRVREDLKFIVRHQAREGERPVLTDEEKVMLFEPEKIQ